MKLKQVMVYPGVVLTMIFWGLSYVWLKVVYRFIGPITTTFLRMAATAFLLTIIVHITGKKQAIRKEDWKFVILLTFFHPFLYFLFESFGLKYVSPTIAAVIVTTIPLFIPIAAFYFFQERLSRMNITGMAISFLGVLLVIMTPDLSFSASPLGIFLLLLAVLSGVAYTTSLRKLTTVYNAFTLVMYQNIFGIFWFGPLFLIFDLKQFLMVPITMDWIVPLILLIIFASMLAFIFYTTAVKELGAAKAGIFGISIPAFTALFSWLFSAEQLSLQQISGVLIVMSGLLISQLRKKHAG
ncbi:MAG: DMT family transporter [Acidobacteria bacterium]|jgi:drug/metabolite transporter (DMT)-like permease|nr:DMT family transporter [Acidobacteriota bacterium]